MRQKQYKWFGEVPLLATRLRPRSVQRCDDVVHDCSTKRGQCGESMDKKERICCCCCCCSKKGGGNGVTKLAFRAEFCGTASKPDQGYLLSTCKSDNTSTHQSNRNGCKECVRVDKLCPIVGQFSGFAAAGSVAGAPMPKIASVGDASAIGLVPVLISTRRSSG